MERANTLSRSSGYRYLNLVTAVFVTCLIIANIIAVKIVDIGGIIVPAAVIIFPISYIFGDILTEVYGYARSRQVIWIGFACNALAVLAIWIGGELPSASFWDGQEAYVRILGYTPRLLGASFVAYLVGEFLNSFVLARMKVLMKGRWLWMRTIGSTLVGQGADSLVFITLAFVGTMSGGQLARVIVTQWLFKCIYEAVATPITYVIVNYLKRVEREDYYDYDTDFNPFKLEA
ncbi:MAG: queuosine precursor transporter [Anaerolineae bacterium]|nr:queuosine precursor transporter [Anaerolineae bacterium]MDW8100252.1 queuosine precursor transporter [Anaerolineae bacterium]